MAPPTTAAIAPPRPCNRTWPPPPPALDPDPSPPGVGIRGAVTTKRPHCHVATSLLRLASIRRSTNSLWKPNRPHPP